MDRRRWEQQRILELSCRYPKRGSLSAFHTMNTNCGGRSRADRSRNVVGLTKAQDVTGVPTNLFFTNLIEIEMIYAPVIGGKLSPMFCIH